MAYLIRPARPSDVPSILELIRELAAYEKAPSEVTVTAGELLSDGFGKKPLYRAIVAKARGKAVGMALYFPSYSTWKGKCIYLEDIIVTEKHRGEGVGKALFEEVIRIACEYGAKRLQFQALSWNKPALDFYRKYGCEISDDWVNVRLTEAKLRQLGAKIGQKKKNASNAKRL